MGTRLPNTTVFGYGWAESVKLAVWAKGTPIDGFPASMWRRDACGRAMKYLDHGNRNSQYGWEVDHIQPVSLGGGDSIYNLQPLQWSVNLHKADKIRWSCPLPN